MPIHLVSSGTSLSRRYAARYFFGVCVAASPLVVACGGTAEPGASQDVSSVSAAASAPARVAGDVLVSLADGTLQILSAAGEDRGVFASGLAQPVGLALDRFGDVYVASLSDNAVHEFSASGNDLGVFASAGLNQPFGLAFDPAGNLFVSNNGDNSIHEFSKTGRELGVIASLLGTGCPAGLVVDTAGHLLVADICANLIRAFSLSGASLGVFASTGLSNPLALAVGSQGHLFASNSNGAAPLANTIHEFSATGADVGTFASSGLQFPAGLAFDRAGDLIVANEAQTPDSVDYVLRRFSASGTDLGDFARLSAQPRFLSITATTPFGSFGPKARLHHPHHGRASLEADAAFTLGSGSNGIDPRAEVVSVRVGALDVSLPAGSFRARIPGVWTFHGVVDGVALQASIERCPAHAFTPSCRGVAKTGGHTLHLDAGVAADDGTGTSGIVALAIGDDGDAATIQFSTGP